MFQNESNEGGLARKSEGLQEYPQCLVYSKPNEVEGLDESLQYRQVLSIR